MSYRLLSFIDESNAIESIHRRATNAEIQAHHLLWAQRRIEVSDLQEFVAAVAPGKPLRDRIGMNVRVGSHTPPRGGPDVAAALRDLLAAVTASDVDAYDTHIAYELLHPFMDGNGRSGRALWAWQMQRDGLDPFALPFLHRFYYQTLDAAR